MTALVKTCSGTPGLIVLEASRATMAACLRLILASTCVSIQVKRATTIKRPTVGIMAVLVVMVQALSYKSKALSSEPRINKSFNRLLMLMLVVVMSMVLTIPQGQLQATSSIHQSPQWFLKMKVLIREGRETSNSRDSSIRYRTLTWSSSN